MKDKGPTLLTVVDYKSVFSSLVRSGSDPPGTPAVRACFTRIRVMGCERARVTDRRDDRVVQFGAGR